MQYHRFPLTISYMVFMSKLISQFIPHYPSHPVSTHPSSCCSVTQSCLTCCDPMDCAHQASLSFAISGACSNSCPLSWWCHPTISFSVGPFFSCLQSFPASGSFLMSQLFALGGQSIGASASASVPPMNIQDWFPLGLTGWSFLQSKGLSRAFYNTAVKKHQFFSIQPSI